MLLQQTVTTTTSTAWGNQINPANWGEQAKRLRLATESAERRRGLRIAQARPVKVLDAIGGRTLVGETIDVSATGLRVQLPIGSALRVGEMLGIHVGLSRIGEKLANRRQMVPVRVVWVGQPIERKGTVVAGVEFATAISAQLDAA